MTTSTTWSSRSVRHGRGPGRGLHDPLLRSFGSPRSGSSVPPQRDRARRQCVINDLDPVRIFTRNPLSVWFGTLLFLALSTRRAHRDTHFRFLQRLRVGDEIVLDVPMRPARDSWCAKPRSSLTIRRDSRRARRARARPHDLLSVRRHRGRRAAALCRHGARRRPTSCALHRAAVI